MVSLLMSSIGQWVAVTSCGALQGYVMMRFYLLAAGLPNASFRKWQGPFVGNTSYPILLVGNSFDPVTPISKCVLPYGS